MDGKNAHDRADKASSEADELSKALIDLEESKAQQRIMNEKQDALIEIVKRELEKRKGWKRREANDE